MWVKICGNTNLEDAALAGELGADAVGFIFAPSKRQVTVEQVAAITPHLPAAVERVGVFDSRDAEEIAATAGRAGLTAVQLHGELDLRLLEQLAKRFAGRVQLIQTLHWVVGEASGARLAECLGSIASSGLTDRVLIDSKVGLATGGTGISYDWLSASEVFSAAPDGLRLIVAGGLKPDTVAEAVRRLAPWGVDVSSGVEASIGRKDGARMRLFVENARGAETP